MTLRCGTRGEKQTAATEAAFVTFALSMASYARNEQQRRQLVAICVRALRGRKSGESCLCNLAGPAAYKLTCIRH